MVVLEHRRPLVPLHVPEPKKKVLTICIALCNLHKVMCKGQVQNAIFAHGERLSCCAPRGA